MAKQYRKSALWAAVCLMAAVSLVSSGCTKEKESSPEEPAVQKTEEPETAARNLTLRDETERMDYTVSDSEIIEEFDAMAEELMNIQSDRMNILEIDGMDNINDMYMSDGENTIGFMAGSFKGITDIPEFRNAYSADVWKNGKERHLLIAEGETIEKLKALFEKAKGQASAAEENFAPTDDASVRSFLEQLGDPEGYRYLINSHDGLKNEETFRQFLDKYEQGMPATLITAKYTIEGDLIYSYVFFDGEGCYYAEDLSRDTYAPDETFSSGYGKYLSFCERDYSEEGRTWHEMAAVIADEQFDSYEAIIESIQNEEPVHVVFMNSALKQ